MSIDDDSAFIRIPRSRLPDHPGTKITFADVWCYIRPSGASHPAQGWKLHVAATAEAAPRTLQLAIDVLFGRGRAAKFDAVPLLKPADREARLAVTNVCLLGH
ncbi:hypothetical protein LWC34_12885 [Kibdelosporangium philippinense]|uniref:RamC N-terminal domain-containing protein n=1 Tax=Kibdelosporangium philippinense TaxID=211113 RepID=A0ABS8Z9C5_9PSEU|nr:hypothetical protein [Kibdelosporangium philippinense]MCE7003714.1 hypothetical protein [Kibdelosporangium philippinense]